MKIRFFNTYEPVVPLYRELVPSLARRGMEVEVVISQGQYRSGDPLPQADGVTYTHIPSVALPDGAAGWRKAADHATYGVGAMRAVLERPVDLNVFLTQPPMFFAAALPLAGRRGQKNAVLMMDVYPHVAVAAGVLKKDSVAHRVLAAASARALRRADGVWVIGRCMRDRVVEMGVDIDRIQVVPNWANADRIRPKRKDRSTLAQELDLVDKFVVMYSGNMGVSHDFFPLFLVAKRLFHEGNRQVHFLCCGAGKRFARMRGWVERSGLTNVTMRGLQPYDRLGDSLAAGDVHFVSLRAGFAGLVVPSKAYGALAVGRPIVYQGEADGEIARMVREEQAGLVVPPDAVQPLYDAVCALWRDPDRVRVMGENARRAAEAKYDTASMVATYSQAVESLVR